MSKNTFRVIGLMSGSSLDGLDMIDVLFEKKSSWTYQIMNSQCISYPEEMIHRLRKATNSSGKELMILDSDLGLYIAKVIKEQFIAPQTNYDLIASHGHTIFHFPKRNLTCQIGNGTVIAQHVGIDVVNDFRIADIAHQGQGAPIVPIGDKLLFSSYDACLNIGGIANISTIKQGKSIAFDICAANQILNALAEEKDWKYDNKGQLASIGQIHLPLLRKLNNLPFFFEDYPKSLDNSFSKQTVLPLIKNTPVSLESKMATAVEHICMKIADNISKSLGLDKRHQILVTGGGAFNSFLITRLKHHLKSQLIIPDTKTIAYKEALIIGLMGVLYTLGEVNVLKSVTGATQDSISGVYHKANF